MLSMDATSQIIHEHNAMSVWKDRKIIIGSWKQKGD